jgi:hypothetical protein
MLRGEAYLRTKAFPPAAEAFAAAAKETTDPAKKDAARANEILVRRSKAQGYLPKPSATSKPAAIPIVEEADRKAAWAALLNDELTLATPKVKAATAGNSLTPIIDVARALGDLRAVEVASGGTGEQVKQIGSQLGDHAHALIDDALKKTKVRVEEVWNSASRTRAQVDNNGNQIQKLYGMMGLTSVESNDLKSAMATCEKVAPVASDLAAVAGGSSDLTADAAEAQRLAARAKEVLQYDYNNEGRYTPTGTSTATGGVRQRLTPPQQRTPQTPTPPQQGGGTR